VAFFQTDVWIAFWRRPGPGLEQGPISPEVSSSVSSTIRGSSMMIRGRDLLDAALRFTLCFGNI
jgi:hypothetical protein